MGILSLNMSTKSSACYIDPRKCFSLHLCDSPISDSCVGGFACFSSRDINVVFLGFVWCFGQAAKEEKLETEQEEDEHAAMTYLENFPGTYMICQICGGWIIF